MDIVSGGLMGVWLVHLVYYGANGELVEVVTNNNDSRPNIATTDNNGTLKLYISILPSGMVWSWFISMVDDGIGYVLIRY